MSTLPTAPPHAIAPYTNDIVNRMFIDTADLNYLGARNAYFEHRYWDFWWLTLHATEKYLKAVALLNGETANGTTHNITALLKRVETKVDSRLVLPPFTKPKISGLDYWPPDQTSFLRRLDDFGSAANRYATYGYNVHATDLMHADQLIYWARRHARPLQSPARQGIPAIDWVSMLMANPSEWHRMGRSLEKIAAHSPQSRQRQSFTRLNAAFFPKMRHQMRGPHMAAVNAPIPTWYQRLAQSQDDSPTRATAHAVLTWVLNSVYLTKEDKAEVIKALADYPATGTNSP